MRWEWLRRAAGEALRCLARVGCRADLLPRMRCVDTLDAAPESRRALPMRLHAVHWDSAAHLAKLAEGKHACSCTAQVYLARARRLDGRIDE